MFVDIEAKKVKAAARALVNNKDDKYQKKRVQELLQVILQYFPSRDINNELLEEAANMESFIYNENYISHGQKVVEHFIEKEGGDQGVVMFERMWRQHFLDTMKPEFLPPMWSVQHRQDWKFED